MTYKMTRRLEFILLAGLVLIYGLATYQRNLIWKDDLTLWSDNVKKSLAKARVYDYSGLAYQKAGDLDEAIQQYRKSLSLDPFYADAHNNIGIAYFDKGLVDNAIIHFKHAIEINPSHADAHYNLGIAYGEKGLMGPAYEEIRKGIRLRRR
jgi:tetratricopeptide (TPR) repeat protein